MLYTFICESHSELVTKQILRQLGGKKTDVKEQIYCCIMNE